MVPEVLGTVLGDGDEPDDAGEIFHAGELEMRTNVSYDPRTGDFEIDDEFGGTALDIPIVKRLLKLIKKHHPELLEGLE